MGCRRKLAAISYLTPIGWLFSYCKYAKMKSSTLIHFHLKQSLGIHLFLIMISFTDIFYGLYFNSLLFLLIYSFFLFAFISGIESAVNGTKGVVPIFGNSFNRLFFFIK